MKEILGEMRSELRNDIKADTEMVTKAELSKIVEVCNQRYNEQQKQIEDLKSTVQKQNKLLDSVVRANNLIFYGVKVEGNESAPLALEKKIVDICENVLKVSLAVSDLNKVFRIGKNKTIGPVLVSFVSNLKRFEVLKNSKNLQKSGISVSKDLSPEEREQRKVLVELCKDLKQKNRICNINRNGLVVDGKFYTVEQLQSGSLEIPNGVSQPNSVIELGMEQEVTSEEDTPREEAEATRKRRRRDESHGNGKDKDKENRGDLRTFFRAQRETETTASSEGGKSVQSSGV